MAFSRLGGFPSIQRTRGDRARAEERFFQILFFKRAFGQVGEKAASRITETGTHEELLEREGVYAELWSSQHERDFTPER
jgi:hypothetical protein